MISYEQHPLSAIFPAMDDTAFSELRADIAAHGLHSPITMFEDKVLDGWHRYRACTDTGVVARYVQFDGSFEQAMPFAVSVNLQRRHLNTSQRAMIGARLSLVYEEYKSNDIKRKAVAVRWDTKREMDELNKDATLSHDARVSLTAMVKRGQGKEKERDLKEEARQVYVAVSGDRMKVGVSSQPGLRVDGLRTTVPDLTLLRTWPGTYADASRVHLALRDEALGDEWFWFCNKNVDLINETIQRDNFVPPYATPVKDAAEAGSVSV